MARGDRSDRDAPEPLARLLARSEAVERELERARDRLVDIAERFDAERPLTDGPAADEQPAVDRSADDRPADEPPADDGPADEQPADDRPADRVIVVPEPVERHEPSRDHDITVLQEAARRRLSDER